MIRKPLFIVYNIASTMQERSFKTKGAAQRFADKLNAKLDARDKRSFLRHRAMESLRWQRDITMRPGEVNHYIAKYEAEIASLEALYAIWGDAKYAVAERMEYDNEVVYDVLINNLMTGKPVLSRSNVPFTSTVASETYWCS